jgi:preprotein translocase subunit SecE
MTGLSGEKKSLVARVRLFVRQVIVELRRVVWPTRKQVTTYTGVVLVFVTALSLIVAVLDFVFGKGILAIFG